MLHLLVFMEFYFFTLEKYYYSVIFEMGLRRLNYLILMQIFLTYKNGNTALINELSNFHLNVTMNHYRNGNSYFPFAFR